MTIYEWKIKKCEWCGNEFRAKQNKQRCCCKYCKLRNNYKHNKKRIILEQRRYQLKNKDKVKKWRRTSIKNLLIRNPEYFNIRQREYYYKNRNKIDCRNLTNKLINKKSIEELETWGLLDKCKLCNSNRILQIHHEIYPTDIKLIEEAIKNGRIYYLCYNCHQKVHTNKSKDLNDV